MIKLIGCIMILCSATAFGFNYGEKLKNRTKELKELQRCIYEIQSHIIYTHTPLPEAVSNVASKAEQPISTLLMEIFHMLDENKVDNVYQAFKNAFLKQREILNLKDEDIDVILDLSKSLGESDIEGQKAVFSLTIEDMKKQIKISESILKKNLKMYRCLGFSVGAVIVILLI
ncbi:stage III sporulation protein SpoAB [Clostridium tyrobutyricum]|nr:stage III sporulation protein SpoIIIAB [Clostridium tyrobutyricum]ANP69770.1 stage III sporulation protein SpoAB [Clostridium tyrobutyricum]MBR9646915.1 stage III sporulation protein SpoAB [Clostridium tyrobutyricum]MBV4415216.1 stage III sporulation protein SpoAB [Clostridium tyrobutyricum]MBV4420887.1 stage III sporulation protein SpoAB [Clostridium tyrobutyricum]MBV4423996.1 stage III sporulation protein SpoAB [Clostridium tyrobutyricum]